MRINKNLTLVVFLVFIIFIQSWFLTVTFTYPYLGISAIQNENGDWFVDKIQSNSRLASQLNIQTGDQIRKVNGVDPNEFNSIITWKTIDKSTSVSISRDGTSIELKIKDTFFEINNDLMPLIAAFISFLLATILYLTMRKTQSVIMLILLFITIGMVFSSLSASIRGDVIGKFFITTGVMLTPIVFFHFLITLFNEKGGIYFSTKYLKYVYLIIICNVIINLLLLIVPALTYTVYQIIIPGSLLFLLIGLLLNFSFILYVHFKYRKEKKYISTIIIAIWLSLFISFSPFVFLFVIPLLLFGEGWIASFHLVWFILFFPISFTYLIATKQILDINTIFRRIKLTTLISILPGALMSGVVVLLHPEAEAVNHFFLLFILFVVILSFLLYSLEYFKFKLEAIIFPRKQHLQQSIQKIAKNLGSISNFRELKDIILVDIVNLLEVYGGAIVFKYDERVEIITEGEIDSEQVKQLIQSEESHDPEFTYMQINHHEDYTSFLILTKKRSNKLLAKEEKDWLTIIISYLSVSMENIYLIRKLTVKLQDLSAFIPDEKTALEMNWFRKITFELQEKERMRIASDLHDTTIQDLYFLKKKLVSLFDQFSLNQEVNNKVTSIYDYIEVINSNLRQSCFELHPHLLQEIGLVETVKKLIERELIVSPFEIIFEAEKPYRMEQYNLEVQKHIFRMIQELMNNAKKHSHAHTVEFHLSVADGSLHIDYKDDGVGFMSQHSISKEIDSAGVGMEQLKSRVVYLEGHVDIYSPPRGGVHIHITIPLKEANSA